MALLGFPIDQQQPARRPESSFIWGQGGRRLTPEDIALQRQMAEQQRMAGADFSPVGSVWEGLGRVVQGFSGSYGRTQANRAEEANRAESQSIAEMLMPEEGVPLDNNAVLQALANPYITDEVRQLAGVQHQRMNARSEASSPLGKIAADEGFIPGTPEFNQRVQQLNEAESRRLLPIEAGGSAITYNPFTGQAEYAVAPAELASQLNSQAMGSAPDTLPADFDFGAQPQMTVTPMELNALVQEFGPQEVQRRLDSGMVTVRGQ